MRTSWHELWGCGRGPASRLAPQIRIMTGAVLFAACMAAPATTVPGVAAVAAGTCAWVLACGTPARIVRGTIVLGLVILLPGFLLAPLIRNDPSGAAWSWSRSLEVPWSMFLRGMSGMLVSVATVSSLSASDLREGLIRMPIPRVVTAIVLQIIHQTATLVDETRQVASAMAVRGASTGGRTAWRVLSSLPQVWLPRVVLRAESVAAAMELRGYGQDDLHSFARIRLRIGDAVALALALGLLGIAVVLRWGSPA